MAVNRHRPHLMVLPEDDRNAQIATGFQLTVASYRQMQILPVAGGWKNVLDVFVSVHIGEMEKYPERFMALIIDFDGQASRIDVAGEAIPANLKERVFVLGVLTEPEDLKAKVGEPYESIGSSLAADCRDNALEMWGHQLLQHNAGELARMRHQVVPLLFA
jgi:hypothetical protein